MFPRSHNGLHQASAPLSLAVLQPLLALLSQRFPPHWLHRALEPLLYPPRPPSLQLQWPARSSSRTPSRSPPRAPSAPSFPPFRLLDVEVAWAACEKNLEASDAAPARSELRALAALWMPWLPRPLGAVLSASTLGGAGLVCMYEVCVSPSGPATAGGHHPAPDGAANLRDWCTQGGRDAGPGASALGLLLYDPHLGRQRGGENGLLRDVRRALRNGRAAAADSMSLHSATAVACRRGAAFVRWPMAAGDFGERRSAGHVCAVFHLDTWMTVGDSHVLLRDAVTVATLRE